jgi:hypothetical protein
MGVMNHGHRQVKINRSEYTDRSLEPSVVMQASPRIQAAPSTRPNDLGQWSALVCASEREASEEFHVQ